MAVSRVGGCSQISPMPSLCWARRTNASTQVKTSSINAKFAVDYTMTEQLAIEPLLAWARAHGTSVSALVEIYTDDVTGLSFRAASDVPPSTSLVNCAYSTTISYLNAAGLAPFQRHSAPFPSSFLDGLSVEDPNVIGHFFLVQQYLLGKDSFWWEYVSLLPQPGSKQALALPALWSEEERSWLDGTNAEPPLRKRRSLWEEEWKLGMGFLRGADWDGLASYTCELYQVC